MQSEWKIHFDFILLKIKKFCFSRFKQVHELPAEKLKIRDVVPIDIANDPISSNDYKPAEDPTK